MGISKQPPKRFPLADKGVACQLKWTHSTVYLTDGISASCHKAGFGKYEVKDGIMKRLSREESLAVFEKLSRDVDQFN